MGNEQDNEIGRQAAEALAALACALVKQRGINGEQLRLDFLECLEKLYGSPAAVETVGIEVAACMDAVLQADRGTLPPSA